MDNEQLIERFAKTESTVQSLLDLHNRLDQKVDTVLQMQIKMASMQETTRSHTEKLDRLFDENNDKEKRLKIVESKVHWGKGVVAVIFAVIIPSTGWILTNAYSQISAIDRRLLGIEYQVQKPAQMNH